MRRVEDGSRYRREFLRWLLAVPTVTMACSSPSGTSGAGPGRVTKPGDTHGTDAGEDDSPTAPVKTDGGPATCEVMSKDLEGPYYENGAPIRTSMLARPGEPGVRLLVEGLLLGPRCEPLKGYALDVWQADKDGNYYGGAGDDFRLRGKIVSDGEGRYRFETVLPGRYGDSAGIRPAHLHVKVQTPRGETLITTQLYFAGDPYLGEADYCTRSRSCDSNDPGRHLALVDATIGTATGKRASFDVVLAKS